MSDKKPPNIADHYADIRRRQRELFPQTDAGAKHPIPPIPQKLSFRLYCPNGGFGRCKGTATGRCRMYVGSHDPADICPGDCELVGDPED